MNIVGYTITLNGKKTIGQFIDEFRKDAKKIVIEEMRSLVAEDVAKLYDAKFLSGAEYPGISIVDLAVRRVKDSIGRVYTGQSRDDKYNLFCNLYLYESRNDQIATDYYAILDCANKRLRSLFERYKEVDDYTYYDYKVKCKKEENEKRKQYWMNMLEDCDYDWTGAGLSAKIVDSGFVRNFDKFTVPSLKRYFPSDKERLEKYLKCAFVSDKVAGYLGNAPIEKIDRHSLSELFLRAVEELESEDGQEVYKEMERKRKSGINVIDEAIISFTPTNYSGDEKNEG